MTDAAGFFLAVGEDLARQKAQPHGPAVEDEPGKAMGTRRAAGEACVDLCNGDRDRGRALWKLVAHDLGGYMPHAAAIALIRASSARHLVLPDEAPEPS